MILRQQLRQLIEKVANDYVRDFLNMDLGVEGFGFEVSPSKSISRGHFSTNIAFILASNIKTSPHNVAASLAEKIVDTELVQRCEVAGAGFLNLWLVPNAWREMVAACLAIKVESHPAPKTLCQQDSEGEFPLLTRDNPKFFLPYSLMRMQQEERKLLDACGGKDSLVQENSFDLGLLLSPQDIIFLQAIEVGLNNLQQNLDLINKNKKLEQLYMSADSFHEYAAFLRTEAGKPLTGQGVAGGKSLTFTRMQLIRAVSFVFSVELGSLGLPILQVG